MYTFYLVQYLQNVSLPEFWCVGVDKHQIRPLNQKGRLHASSLEKPKSTILLGHNQQIVFDVYFLVPERLGSST